MSSTANTATHEQTALNLRSDARRNRDRLIAVAREAFAQYGADASLDEIARRAGVGPGTLYRHFPNRLALMESVYRDNVETLCASASELITAPSPGDALAQWLRAFLDYAVTKRGLAKALMGVSGERPSFFSTCHEMITESASALLDRAQAAGAIRKDLELWDLLKLVGGIAMTCEQTPDCDEAMADRLLSIVMDGVRAQPQP
jgi:AcrR family transcriptional regulator